MGKSLESVQYRAFDLHWHRPPQGPPGEEEGTSVTGRGLEAKRTGFPESEEAEGPPQGPNQRAGPRRCLLLSDWKSQMASKNPLVNSQN